MQEGACRKITGRKRHGAVTVPRPDDARGVYGISVAAELVGMGVQTLRLYEARGLLDPERTGGGTRRYSTNDLDRIRAGEVEPGLEQGEGDQVAKQRPSAQPD